MLCKVGADINAQTKDDLDWTALHIAALNGYPEVVKVLLKVSRYSLWHSPFQLAGVAPRGIRSYYHIPFLSLPIPPPPSSTSSCLLAIVHIGADPRRYLHHNAQHNADTTMKCCRGETPLEWAKANSEEDCIKLLEGK